jgi:hypothetical protein
MDRKDFLKKGLLSTGALAVTAVAAKGLTEEESTHPKEKVGFNHIPVESSKISTNMIIHKANSRGVANHGWLNSRHSFSFANYYNPERMNFGVLRVLNDDIIAGGTGFSKHPHDNMEIISIPLEGKLVHKDSMGNEQVIQAGDVQVMSAGTGIFHSEMNGESNKETKFLQIWVYPNKKGVTPRYDQIKLKEGKVNEFQQILSPSADDDGVWIHQDAWFDLGELNSGFSLQHKVRKPATNGVYAFILKGKATIGGQALEERDAIGVWSVDTLDIKADADARILLMEVPMA